MHLFINKSVRIVQIRLSINKSSLNVLQKIIFGLNYIVRRDAFTCSESLAERGLQMTKLCRTTCNFLQQVFMYILVFLGPIQAALYCPLRTYVFS